MRRKGTQAGDDLNIKKLVKDYDDSMFVIEE